jgi:hypothetical protein
MADQLVLTPGGFRPQSMVHLIDPGHIVDQTANRLLHLDVFRNVLEDFGTLSLRPASRPLMPANVARLAALAGAALSDAVAAAAVPTFGSGWITYAYWTNSSGKPVSSFRTTWVVPPAPSTMSGQTIFLFNGIQNSTMIYQPVLQWGHRRPVVATIGRWRAGTSMAKAARRFTPRWFLSASVRS